MKTLLIAIALCIAPSSLLADDVPSGYVEMCPPAHLWADKWIRVEEIASAAGERFALYDGEWCNVDRIARNPKTGQAIAMWGGFLAWRTCIHIEDIMSDLDVTQEQPSDAK